MKRPQRKRGKPKAARRTAAKPRGEATAVKARQTPDPRRRVAATVPGRLRWLALFGRVLGSVVWLAVLWNAAVPMLRCEPAWANKLLFLAAMFLPWSWLRTAWTRPTIRARVIACAAVVACGIGGPWFAWHAGAWAVERKLVSAVDLPAGGRVVAWQERDPGSKHCRLLARQERQWLPGILVVRVLARHPDSRGGRVEMLGSDTVRIRPARVLGEVPAIVCHLKPWAWWGKPSSPNSPPPSNGRQ